MKTYSTIVDVLRDRAATTPDRLAYSFVSETPTNVNSLTYQQLETKVKAIARLSKKFKFKSPEPCGQYRQNTSSAQARANYGDD